MKVIVCDTKYFYYISDNYLSYSSDNLSAFSIKKSKLINFKSNLTPLSDSSFFVSSYYIYYSINFND